MALLAGGRQAPGGEGFACWESAFWVGGWLGGEELGGAGKIDGFAQELTRYKSLSFNYLC